MKLHSKFTPVWLALQVAAILALAGCAVGPDFKPAVPEAPADFSAWHGGSPELVDAQRALAKPGATPFGWSIFGDPVLIRLEERALAANSDVQAAALRFAQSRVQGSIVRSQRLPQVNASGSVSRVRESEDGDITRILGALNPANRDQIIKILADPHDLYQAGFDASWEVDLWGRVGRAMEAADANAVASQAMLAQVQLSVQAELARRYFDLRSLQRQIRIARSDIEAGQETRDLVQARANGGLTTDLDVVRQDAQLADVRAKVPQLLMQEAQAANAITLLAGERPGALAAELAAQPDAPVAALPDLSMGLPSEVALRRPDIQSAEAQLHAATADIGVAVADLYPRITIGANFGFLSVTDSAFAEWGSRQWSIGPSLQLPIFDGGRRRATVTLRKLQQQQAAVAYQQTVLKAWQEIDDAMNAYAAESQRNAELARRERSSRDALLLARVRYESGLTDFLVQLDAQRNLLQAQRDYAESTGRLATGLVSISKALALPAPLVSQAVQVGSAPNQD
ncbi:efflux transporter outer membrane subunit [Variovorax sp. J22R133]|uniref:efflux transporter outer membrane subunit n=1 Tax=Variovorax brevis TaxID=3053503 RepID=UPI0025757C48|nr:efflux transporter outer membrane subunit [Variovorax sp. J22R133]MDM0113226.1 efflux transporter outer membrane subunit [Variovorax sp. J22R133]